MHAAAFKQLCFSSFLFSAKQASDFAAMEPALKLAMEKIKDEKGMAINLKSQKILQLLSGKGYLYEQVVQPHLLIVHSQNRSGLMLNSFDMQEKGLLALKVGWQESKVSESYCFELSAVKEKKESQLEAMRKLVENSEKKLAPVNGMERFMTVSCSHMSQFAKAAWCGQCSSDLEELQPFTLESLEGKFQDDQFSKMVKQGWNWKCIQSQVEDACPWLPQMLQAALNTGNQIAKEATEMEVAMSIAYLHKAHQSMDTAIELCQASTPSSCTQVVAEYMASFGGGPGFPVMVFLQAVQKLFNSSLKLGEDYMTSVTKADFKSKDSTYPMIRACLIAANLSSPKSCDGIAKLLLKGDVEK